MLFEKQQKKFDAILADSIPVNPECIKIAGNVTYGILLTQLILIGSSHDFESFSAPDNYMKERYGFSRHQLLHGRKRLVSIGLISTKKRIDGKLYYTFNIGKLKELGLI